MLGRLTLEREGGLRWGDVTVNAEDTQESTKGTHKQQEAVLPFAEDIVGLVPSPQPQCEAMRKKSILLCVSPRPCFCYAMMEEKGGLT